MSFNFTTKEFILGNGTGTPTFQFYRKGFELQGGGSGPSWQDIVLSGNGALTLSNAKANGLEYLKLFGGTEQRNLPKGHTQLEYVYMTEGSGIRVEDLPISAGYKVEFDFQTTTLNSSLRNYIGGRANNVSAGGGFRLSKLASSNNNRVVLYGFETGTEYYDPTTQFQRNTRYKYTYHNGVCTLESGGEVISTNTFTVTDDTSTDWGINDYASSGAFSAYHDPIYVYSVKVWNTQGELVMDLVPDKTSSNVVCFYDMATDTLRTASIGTFEAGAEATPTPSTPMDIVCNNGVVKARHQSGLPFGYQLLSSLTSDGRCLVNTGIVLQEGDEIDLDYSLANPQPSTLPGDRFLFGTANVDTSKGGTWTEVYSTTGDISSAAWYARFSSPASVNGNLPVTTLSGHLTLKQEQLIINGTTGLTPNYVGTFQTTELTLFGRYDADQTGYKGAKMTVTHFTVKNGNAYRFNGVMVKRLSDNALGIYDLVSDTFCGNIGDGTFTAGNPVDDLEIYTDGTIETVKDSLNNTATAENLLAVGTYKDVQEVLTGTVTRNVGIKVLDGTESWFEVTSYTGIYGLAVADGVLSSNTTCVCSHYQGTTASNATMENDTIKAVHASVLAPNKISIYIKDTDVGSLANFKTYLATQYAAETPVIVVYPFVTATTESVTAQHLTTKSGTNTIEITQASINNLPLEVSYKGTV